MDLSLRTKTGSLNYSAIFAPEGVITHEDTAEITITDVPEITIEDR